MHTQEHPVETHRTSYEGYRMTHKSFKIQFVLFIIFLYFDNILCDLVILLYFGQH